MCIRDRVLASGHPADKAWANGGFRPATRRTQSRHPRVRADVVAAVGSEGARDPRAVRLLGHEVLPAPQRAHRRSCCSAVRSPHCETAATATRAAAPLARRRPSRRSPRLEVTVMSVDTPTPEEPHRKRVQTNKGFGQSVAFSAGRGALLIGIAIVIGIVLLQTVDNPSPSVGDGGGGGPGTETTVTSDDTTGDTTATTAASPSALSLI